MVGICIMKGVRLKHWLPPVLWMAIIVGFSTEAGSSAHTEHWLLPLLRGLAPWATPPQLDAVHWLARKIGHLSEYAILAALWLRALARGRGMNARRAGLTAFVITAAWAALDELHQTLVPSRTASIADVVLDSTGALIALVIAHLGWQPVAGRATTLLLWAAFIGSVSFLVLNALTGVPSDALWVTAPTAAVALLLRTWHGRKRPHRP